MALVEKNEGLKGKIVELDGLTISWDEREDDDAPEEGNAPKKPLKTKDDDLKTKKVVV